MSATIKSSVTRAMSLQMLLAGMLVAAPYIIGSAATLRPTSADGELYSEICTSHGTMKVDANGQPIVGPGQRGQECCHLCVASTPQVAFGSGFSVQVEPGVISCVQHEALSIEVREKLVRRMPGYAHTT